MLITQGECGLISRSGAQHQHRSVLWINALAVGQMRTGELPPLLALTVILLGFNNDRAGKMALSANAWLVAALNRCGELPRGPRYGGRRCVPSH